MSNQRKILHDSNGLDYVLVGDYYRPTVDLPYLLVTGKLDSYLVDLNEQVQERYELIEAHVRSAEGVTEELKVQNPMEWVRQCNNIRNRVQEIVLSELVYV